MLEKLCVEPIVQLYKYDTVKLQYWKRLIVYALSHLHNKEHDHGHAYILEDTKRF